MPSFCITVLGAMLVVGRTFAVTSLSPASHIRKGDESQASSQVEAEVLHALLVIRLKCCIIMQVQQCMQQEMAATFGRQTSAAVNSYSGHD